MKYKTCEEKVLADYEMLEGQLGETTRKLDYASNVLSLCKQICKMERLPNGTLIFNGNYCFNEETEKAAIEMLWNIFGNGTPLYPDSPAPASPSCIKKETVKEVEVSEDDVEMDVEGDDDGEGGDEEDPLEGYPRIEDAFGDLDEEDAEALDQLEEEKGK